MQYSLGLYALLTLIVNGSTHELRIKYSVAECNPVMQVKKPVEGKENKLDTRCAVPKRRSVKRFRSPGLDDASPGKYNYKVFKHCQGFQGSQCCV
jgi:hypothetical protein